MRYTIYSLILTATLILASCGNQSSEKSAMQKNDYPVAAQQNVNPATSQKNNNPATSQKNNNPATSQKNNNPAAVKSNTPVHLTREDFLAKVMNYEKNTSEWVFEGDKPCLIDFYADWCAPCRMAAPILEELAAEYSGQIDVYKIDTEKERELAAVFGVRSIPSFLFVPVEGRPTMSQGVGRTEEETRQMFREQIETLLLN